MDPDRAKNFLRRNGYLKRGGREFSEEDLDAVCFYLERRNPGFGIWEDDELNFEKLRRLLSYRDKNGGSLLLKRGSSQNTNATSKLLSFLESETETRMAYILPEELMKGNKSEFMLYAGKGFKGNPQYFSRAMEIYSLAGVLRNFSEITEGPEMSFVVGEGKNKIGVALLETENMGNGRGQSYSAFIVEGETADEIVKGITGERSYQLGDAPKEELLAADSHGAPHIKQEGKYVSALGLEADQYDRLANRIGADPLQVSGLVFAILDLANRLGYRRVDACGYTMRNERGKYTLSKSLPEL